MNALLDALNDNLQQAYRKAVDADNMLDQLQKDGKGKFSSVFPENSPFKSTSKRFLPYVQELASDIEELKKQDEQSIKDTLPVVVKKLELLLSTLVQLKTKA